MTYFYLIIAVIAEVIAASALKASMEFTRLYPTLLMLFAYAVSLYFMTLVLRVLPLGITYAIWSGAGIILVAIVGTILYKQTPDLAAIVGMGFIIVGILIINLFSKMQVH